ncbi:MAG: thiamine diphosphokinase [Dehalococcoidia bacterium]|nr:thiamine diphosphokinase [Dehalococcoidia bacterium]
MKAIVVLHGDLPRAEFIKNLAKGVKLIIAADGAAGKLLAMGIKPTTVVGDMDSLDKNALEKIKLACIEVIKLPVEKDFTDGFFALEEASMQGASEISLLGVFGGPRLDHSVANLLMLCAKKFDGIPITAVDERNSITVVRKHTSIEGKRGEIISLIPVAGRVTGIYTDGLKYPLANGTLDIGATRGISNVMTSSKASVKIKSGLLLVGHHNG